MSRVMWEIDIDDAFSPIEAAVAAFFHMQRRYTTANVFDVVDVRGDMVRVDLEEERETNPASEALMETHDRRERVYYVLAILGTGVPITHGPLHTTGERNECARAIAADANDPIRGLYYAELSPMNFEIHQLQDSELNP